MKKPGEKIFHEEVPAAHRRSVLEAARAEMEGERAGLFSFLFRPAFGLSLAAAAVAVVIVYRAQTEVPGHVAFQRDPEMVREAELLYDLKVLQKLDVLEKAGTGKWRKPKS